MKTFVIPFLSAGVLTLAMLTSCKGAGEAEKPQIPTVKVAQATHSTVAGQKEFPFMTRPFRSSELSFRVGGPIDRFEVYAGNYYRQGSIIAEIDPRDFRIRKERTEAVYRQAKAEYERVRSLYAKNNLPASVFEKAEADYISAKAAFDTATNELNDTRLIAPFDGYVGEVYIEKFQDVKATQPVISFIDIHQLKIETYVTQDIAFCSPRPASVSLRFDAHPDTVYRAQIAEISKSTTRNNLSYLLTALLPNEEGTLLSGMSGKVGFDAPADGTKLVSVPQSALCHRPSTGDYVWVVDAATQKVSQRPITLDALQPDQTATVRSGLQAGETVAISGLRFLSDQTEVEIQH